MDLTVVRPVVADSMSDKEGNGTDPFAFGSPGVHRKPVFGTTMRTPNRPLRPKTADSCFNSGEL